MTLKSIGYINSKEAYAQDSSKQNEVDQIATRAELNAAQACLRLRRWDDAVRHCDSVLKKNPLEAKALYRKATALRQKGEYEEVRKCISQLQSVNSSLGQYLLQAVNKEDREHRKEEKKLWNDAFRNLEAAKDVTQREESWWEKIRPYFWCCRRRKRTEKEE
ncbi:conserved hypothetical protein [Perkinsus marinus ATCC 50983]|uniref:Uncharacterized protein n=1 Tax=Perkinsus marinus (strain ATCC 50983 / TXsc) TaxID=423536 RepID=C5KCD4_PERM5|nr:conserved hypothetical protein [Perkinsus marinus ATCC 50983]EER17861.1 conserved hypothetical protein [Perkinsus marinus ATCC 50983]|eukprot:XP_002786065.1 conserved hypothetical protein [Perkinsus marinus ATCC 50983]